MHLIVGLGNPGQKYLNTRHNAGFMALERLAGRRGFDPPAHFLSSLMTKGRLAGRPVVLVWPQTFMNLSGEAAREVVSFYKIEAEDILVMHDEMDLEPGRLKLAWGGSAAGHRGLSSLLAMLRCDFARLKIGIGRPPREIFTRGNADYVLGPFVESEWPLVDQALNEAALAAEMWLGEGLVVAQNHFNRRPPCAGQ
ncbi:MAG: aminoacyl-tRNA hydrolase [Candidatus Adiutrix sp.]|nr:aminoacyl-tRNA hydrolase [Candidatus Adiutrix sp.]